MRTRLVGALCGLLLLHTATRGVAQDPADVGGAAGQSPASVDVARAKALGVSLEYDTPPRPIKVTRPEYPKSAFKKGIEGTVVVEFVIDRRGRASKARVVTSVPELDAAALKCMKAWRFEPAIKDGQAVETMAHAPVVFKIKAGAPPKPQEPH